MRLETACNQHVQYLPDVLDVLSRSAAVHDDVVNVALGAAHQAGLLQLLQHDAVKYSWKLAHAEGGAPEAVQCTVPPERREVLGVLVEQKLKNPLRMSILLKKEQSPISWKS